MKKLSAFLCSMVLVFGISVKAEAWYLQIGPTYINIYGEHSIDITWEGGEGEEVQDINLAVTWDTGASPATSPFAVEIPVIYIGRCTAWAGGLGYGVDDNIIYDINGHLYPDPCSFFYPTNGTKLVSVNWLTDPGEVDFTSYEMEVGVETVGITVDDTYYELGATTNGLRIFDDGEKIGPDLGPFSTAIPTVSEWGMIILFIFMLVAALWIMKRRIKQNPV